MEQDSAGADRELRDKLKLFIAELDRIISRKGYRAEATSPQGRELRLPNGLILNLTYHKGRPCGFKLTLEEPTKTPLLVASDFPEYSDSRPEMPCVEVRGMFILGSEYLTLAFQADAEKRVNMMPDGKLHPEFVDKILAASKEWVAGKDVETVRRKYFPEGVPPTELEKLRDELCERFLSLFKRWRRSS